MNLRTATLWFGLTTTLAAQPTTNQQIDTTASGALCAGNNATAIAALLADTDATDQGYRLFKLGIANFRSQRFDKASFYFLLSSQKSPELAPFSYEFLADIALINDRPMEACATLQAAIELGGFDDYQQYLRNKIQAIVRTRPDTPALLAWLETSKAIAPGIADTVRIMIRQSLWSSLDTLLSEALDRSRRSDVESLLTMLPPSAVPSAAFSTPRMVQLCKAAIEAKHYEEAREWLDRVGLRRDGLQAMPMHDALQIRIKAGYALRDNGAVVAAAEVYSKKFGYTPDVLYTHARALRRQNRDPEANALFGQYLRRFPDGTNASDILWFRGFDLEAAGNFSAAVVMYRSLYRRFPKDTQADNAFFRCGLCYYKQKEFAAASAEFTAFAKKHIDSPLTTAAHYWNALCYSELANRERELSLLRNAAMNDPTDFYGYRARMRLDSLQDTAQLTLPDSIIDPVRARQWLDSLSKGTPVLSHEDSLAWRVGSFLAFGGMGDRAELFLRPFEMRYPRNLLLQYDLAKLYANSGAAAAASRTGLRFSWRIPGPARRSTPGGVYATMYPLLYVDTIIASADAARIDAALVFGLIRQESIFDPVALSSAGARGLMQIMPATGSTLAKTLGRRFAADSLFNPGYNIRFGTTYLRQLLDQWNGDLVCTIASYNGGPHNVTRWQQQNIGKPFDLFVEDIGFSETRNYVKKVLANYWTYRRLVRNGAGL